MSERLLAQVFGSSHFGSSVKLFRPVIVFQLLAVMPPRRSPRLAELAASQRAESVPIALEDDDTESLQSTNVLRLFDASNVRG